MSLGFVSCIVLCVICAPLDYGTVGRVLWYYQAALSVAQVHVLALQMALVQLLLSCQMESASEKPAAVNQIHDKGDALFLQALISTPYV